MIDLSPNHDLYLIKFQFQSDRHPIRIEYDAREMVRKGHNQPGLGRYAVIEEHHCNVKFANKAVDTWGFRVRDGLVVEKGDEIIRPF